MFKRKQKNTGQKIIKVYLPMCLSISQLFKSTKFICNSFEGSDIVIYIFVLTEVIVTAIDFFQP